MGNEPPDTVHRPCNLADSLAETLVDEFRQDKALRNRPGMWVGRGVLEHNVQLTTASHDLYLSSSSCLLVLPMAEHC